MKKKLTVAFEEETLKQLDDLAKQYGRKRAELIRFSVTAHIPKLQKAIKWQLAYIELMEKPQGGR